MESRIILIIGYVWPEPSSSAAGLRMMQLIKGFLAHDYQVIFATPAIHSEHAFPLETLDIKSYSIQPNDDDFDKLLVEINPGMVVFDRFMMEEQFGWRVSEALPNAIKILDTEDLHFLRKARQQANKMGIPLGLNELQNQFAKREIASILRCDLSLIISQFEYQLLVDTFKVLPSLLFYFPIWLEPNDEARPSFELRKDFVFIGNFYHEPNRHAVNALKEHIWPLIRKKLPDATMLIYGAYCDEQILKLNHDKTGFLIKGRAEEVNHVMQSARVCLAPLYFGAGLKGKLLDALVCETPSITTTIGAEGIAQELPWPGFIADDYAQFADHAVTLYTSKIVWESSVQTGKKIVNNNFNKGRFEPKLFQQLSVLTQTLGEHRQQNFIGQILQHHLHTSTKYLSKYIMAKNKKAENRN